MKIFLEQLEIKVKYEGYIQKAIREADKMQRLESKHIPEQLDYTRIKNISSEAREKLIRIKPQTLGQASRNLRGQPSRYFCVIGLLRIRSNES